MGRLTFFTREALRAMRKNIAPTTAAVVTTVLTAILIGVLVPVFQTTQSVLARSRAEGVTPVRAAEREAEARITAERESKARITAERESKASRGH